jgi:hypothetical protein
MQGIRIATRSDRSQVQDEWVTASKRDTGWPVSQLGLCLKQADSHRSPDSRRSPHWISERMPRRRQSNVANHLPASRGLPPIRHIFILPSEALAARLKNVETISGGRRMLKAMRLEALGTPSKQRAVRRNRKAATGPRRVTTMWATSGSWRRRRLRCRRCRRRS